MPLLGRRSQVDDAREAAYRSWFARQHPLALASMLLSGFSLTHFGTLFLDAFPSFLDAACRHDFHLMRGKHPLKGLADEWFVVNDQELHHARSPMQVR